MSVEYKINKEGQRWVVRSFVTKGERTYTNWVGSFETAEKADEVIRKLMHPSPTKLKEDARLLAGIYRSKDDGTMHGAFCRKTANVLEELAKRV